MSPVLLDKHFLLWAVGSSKRIPPALRRALVAGERPFLYSPVSLWEIQIKYDLGKLTLPRAPREFLLPALRESGLREWPLENEAIFFLSKRPPLHREPFDRLLIAQTAVRGWEIASDDPMVQRYPVRLYAG